MRIVIASIAGLLAASCATAAFAQAGQRWPAAPQSATFIPASTSSFQQATRKQTAERAARMINRGDCTGALRMVLQDGDFKLAQRVEEVCRTNR